MFKPRHHVAEKYYRTELSQLNEWMNFFYETYQIDSNITGVQYTGLEIFDRKGNTHRISKSKKNILKSVKKQRNYALIKNAKIFMLKWTSLYWL